MGRPVISSSLVLSSYTVHEPARRSRVQPQSSSTNMLAWRGWVLTISTFVLFFFLLIMLIWSVFIHVEWDLRLAMLRSHYTDPELKNESLRQWQIFV